MEPVAACGTDEAAPTCALAPVCDEPTIFCRAPHYDKALGAWVRIESRETGARRLEIVAEALADAATYAGAGWRDGAVDLARAMLAASAWSTGLREDIQVGRKRGPAGELCLMDIQPAVLRTAVPWDLAGLEAEALAQKVVGREYPELRRCFDAGAVLLVRARRWSEQHCRDWPADYSIFAAYGTGISCSTVGRLGDYARLRARSYRKFRATNMIVFPDWYHPSRRHDGAENAVSRN